MPSLPLAGELGTEVGDAAVGRGLEPGSELPGEIAAPAGRVGEVAGQARGREIGGGLGRKRGRIGAEEDQPRGAEPGGGVTEVGEGEEDEKRRRMATMTKAARSCARRKVTRSRTETAQSAGRTRANKNADGGSGEARPSRARRAPGLRRPAKAGGRDCRGWSRAGCKPAVQKPVGTERTASAAPHTTASPAITAHSGANSANGRSQIRCHSGISGRSGVVSAVKRRSPPTPSGVRHKPDPCRDRVREPAAATAARAGRARAARRSASRGAGSPRARSRARIGIVAGASVGPPIEQLAKSGRSTSVNRSGRTRSRAIASAT